MTVDETQFLQGFGGGNLRQERCGSVKVSAVGRICEQRERFTEKVNKCRKEMKFMGPRCGEGLII